MAFIKLPIQLHILRKHINYDLAFRLTVPMCIGSLMGLRILTVTNNDLILKRLFGYIISAISLYHLVSDSIKDSYNNIDRNNNEQINSNNNNQEEVLYISYGMKNDFSIEQNEEAEKFQINTRRKEIMIYFTGFIAGVLAGIYGSGGPPLMILATHIKIRKDEWRGTCTLSYFLQNLVAATYISTYNEYNRIGGQYIMTFLLICTVLAALYCGNIIADRINADLWKKLILLLLMIGSGIMICTGYPAYIQIITMLLLITVYGLVYIITLKYLGIEIISTIRNRYYNIPIEENIPNKRNELHDLN